MAPRLGLSLLPVPLLRLPPLLALALDRLKGICQGLGVVREPDVGSAWLKSKWQQMQLSDLQHTSRQHKLTVDKAGSGLIHIIIALCQHCPNEGRTREEGQHRWQVLV